MKIIKLVLISLAMGLFINNIALAKHYNPVLKVEGNKFYLILENVSSQTSVRILDLDGFTWVEEKVAVSKQFKKVFNLDSLPSGSYTFIIKSNLKETVQPITITPKGVIMDESKRAEYFQAHLLQKRKNVKISLLNPSNRVVRIFVLNPEGRVLYQDAIKDLRIIDKNYNLKQLPAGHYTVLVDNAHEIFTRNINLR